MTVLVGYIVVSVVGTFLSGWVVGRYGHPSLRAQREMLPRRLLAAELARTNKMVIK